MDGRGKIAVLLDFVQITYPNYNLKKQLKFQIFGIIEEIDSFYWPTMHFLNNG